MSKINATSQWKDLESHSKTIQSLETKDMFKENPNRFPDMSIKLENLLFDYSKNHVDEKALSLLVDLAKEANLEEMREAMFNGKNINTTEDRAVLHTALRAGDNAPNEVKETLEKMSSFTNKIRDSKKITDIVNIGIGGSSLGPELATKALKAYHTQNLKAHYVANVEASHLYNVLEQINPETTLFIIASKTFTTAETMQNANLAKEWFKEQAPNAKTEDHFCAVSTNIDACREFGIAEENIFPMWNWVGGRYSVWSAIGLSTMMMIGAENFVKLHKGALAMDNHFKSAPLDKNIPVLSALLGIWYRNFCNLDAYAVIPYHSNLGRLPAWLQQLDMESNGKGVDKSAEKVSYATGPMIFGEPGTDSQHSFFQWIHQSPTVIPVDFIVAAKGSCGTKDQQDMLLANCFAQSEALMNGKVDTNEPYRNFTGNRPSTTIIIDELSPYTLGMLLSLYENKVFVQGIIWDINSFDQWGVELGKVLAKALQKEIANNEKGEHDASTLGLLDYVVNARKDELKKAS